MQYVHEGEVGAIADLITTIINDKNAKNAKKAADLKKQSGYLNGSISNATKNLILTWPVLCDNSLPPSTASMISKANERNIVTMLEMLFSSMQLNGTSGQEVLATIHKNINMNMSMDDIIDAVDNYVDNNGSRTLGESCGLSDIQVRECIKEMVTILKQPMKSFPVESLSESSVNDYTVYNIHNSIVVREAPSVNDKIIDAMGTDDEVDSYQKRLRAKQTKNQIDDADTERAQRDKEAKNQANQYRLNNDMTQALSRQLMDSDIKKANELQPTLMIVRYNELDTDGTIYAQHPFVAGVKSRLIAVDSSDIIDRMAVKNRTKVSFLNLIRATTGEIHFFRDFLLCMDQAKIDAKNAVKKGPAAAMWKILEQRASKNFRNKNKKISNDASAITTLVLNQETVNILKNQYDFDIENIKNARMILDAYNLLGIMIADESIEVVKVLYAGNDSFEQQAYSALEREQKDTSYKKVVNLLGKVGR